MKIIHGNMQKREYFRVCLKKFVQKKKEINCLTEMAKKRIEGGGDNEGESRRGIIGFYFTRK